MDLARLGKRGLDMNLRNEMKYYGLYADVFAVVVLPNVYEGEESDDPFLTALPDTTWSALPRARVMVRLGNTISGLNIGPNGISESDKIMTEIELVCLEPLVMGEKVVVNYPDRKPLTLRITQQGAQNDYSQISYQYIARVI